MSRSRETGDGSVSTDEPQIRGLHIEVETSPDYEVPEGIRDALERLSEAIVDEAQNAEVSGFSAPELGGFSLNPSPGRFGPKAPLQNICLGGFSCSSGYGGGTNSTDCPWIFSD